MKNARQILMHIQAVIGSHQRTEREIYNFCSWVEVQVMSELFAGLPNRCFDNPHMQEPLLREAF